MTDVRPGGMPGRVQRDVHQCSAHGGPAEEAVVAQEPEQDEGAGEGARESLFLGSERSEALIIERTAEQCIDC